MDLIGWVMLRSEDQETLVQDLRARRHHGRAWGTIADTAAQVRSVQTGTRRTDDAVGAAGAGTLTRAAQVSGVSPPNQRPSPAATAFHFALGMLPGAFYGAARRTRPSLQTGHGALYGLILFVVMMDETAAPLTGVASNPGRYPWQAHARGLVAHLVLGVVTETLLQAAERFR